MTIDSSIGDGPGAQARTPAERTASAEPAAGGTERRAVPSQEDLDELAYRITAISEHPVTQYVRELPFESALYPANMYHGLSDGSDDCRKGLITWCPPGHDQERPKREGCGFIREKGSVGDEGIRFTACSGNAEHYARGRRSHCWSLHCPECMNDASGRGRGWRSS